MERSSHVESQDTIGLKKVYLPGRIRSEASGSSDVRQALSMKAEPLCCSLHC